MLVTGIVVSTHTAEALSDTTCRGDIAFIRVRGSGDSRANDGDLNRPRQEGNSNKQLTMDAFSKAFRARAGAAGVTVNEYDLAYPALSVGVIGDDLKYVHLLDSAYLDSVRQGEDNLKTVLASKRACSNQRLVLAGYSQGALVIGDVVRQLSADDASRIRGIALFGDPLFDPADPAARGPYDASRHGIIGTRQIGDVLGGRSVSYCYDDDLVCQGLNAATVSAGEAGNVSLVKQILNLQKNAHARGYPCVALASDDACRSYVDAGKASMAREGGNYIADLLGLRSPSAPARAGTEADQMVIESTDGQHMYVAAGGSLFWFNRSDASQRDFFLGQMRAVYGQDTQPLRRTPGEIHAIEINRDTSGNVAPGSHMVRDHTLVLDGSASTMYEVAGGVRHYVGNPAQAECFHVNYGSTAVRIPNMNGNLPSVGGNALCQYPQNVAFYAPGGQERWRFSGTGPYTRERYANPLALHCYLGYTVTSKEIPSWLVDGQSNSPPEGPSLNCPNGSFVRVVETGQVFLVDNGVLRYVPNPATLTCLAGRPDPYIGSIPSGINATQGSNAACSYEGRILVGTDGRQHWINGSQRYYIGNTVISDCIRIRNGTGQPIPESPGVIGSYTDAGRSAWCPYPDKTLVRGNGQTQVWQVYADGTRRWVTCLPPNARVAVVPAGEPDGHAYLGQISLC